MDPVDNDHADMNKRIVAALAALGIAGATIVGVNATSTATTPKGPIELYTVIESTSFHTVGQLSAFCEEGDYATGGGASVNGGGTEILRSSQPVQDLAGDAREWYAIYDSTSGYYQTMFVYVICAKW